MRIKYINEYLHSVKMQSPQRSLETQIPENKDLDCSSLDILDSESRGRMKKALWICFLSMLNVKITRMGQVCAF